MRLRAYRHTTDGINHRTGRPVRVFAHVGWDHAHFEIGHHAVGVYAGRA